MTLREFRARLDKAFSPETAVPGTASAIPSAGHCAAVAVLFRESFGGEFVSTRIDGQSHWFNRLGPVDIDLTGDQFGRPAVQVADAGTLYPETRVRDTKDVNNETIERARRLNARAALLSQQDDKA